LTGGSPRTTTMLFKLIINGFAKEINDDLEALLDEITPLYKARFEKLSTQMQVIVDAIALHWDPINLEQLRDATRLGNSQLSPQIKRLLEVGWIESLDAYKAKGKAYQISERFFNIWFLMRRSSRRQKRELYCLSRFLESFYGEELLGIAKNRMSARSENLQHVDYDLAIALAVNDPKIKKALEDKSYQKLRELMKDNPRLKEIYDIPADELERKEKRLLKETEKNENDPWVWMSLGYFYFRKKFNFEKSEKAYLKSLEVDKEFIYSMNGLGNLYQDHFKKYDEAEKAYLKAIEVGELHIPKYNLVFLYRDKLNQIKKAEELFETIEKIEEVEDSIFLHKTLFELYRRNEGTATHYFDQALEKINDRLPPLSQDDWWRFGTVVSKLGYADWLLERMKDKGFDKILVPYYIAIKAMNEKEPEKFLNSKAVEIREPAKLLIERMKKYL
jgi:tetratricopeptide (TPR) repeat protein